MPLIEPPAVDDWQPGAVHRVKRVPQRVGRALEHAGVGDVKVIACIKEQFTCVFGLGNAGIGQRNIGPAGKTILQIPGGFAVAYEYKFVHKKGFSEGLKIGLNGGPATSF